MKVIPPWKIWSMRSLAMSSLRFGLYLSVPLLCMFPFLSATQLSPPVAGIVVLLLYFGTLLIGVPAVALHRCRFHLETLRRRVVSILWAVVGVSLVHYGVLLAGLFTGSENLLSWRLPLVHMCMAALWLAASSLVYPAARRIAPFKIQDGSTCPGCGHYIRGVWSQVCPECGCDFDHSNLGLSIAEFDERHGPGVRVVDQEGPG